jgi:hypothetical protein
MLVKGQIKNRPKRRRGTSAAVTGHRKKQKLPERVLRAIRRNPFTRRVIAGEAELQRRITANPELAADFEFLLRKTGWNRGLLLRLLYWDSNIMHADRQTILRGERVRAWPLDRNTLKTILRDISVLADQIERLNQMDLSPAQSMILRTKTGVEFNPRDAKRLLRTFRDLPEILRFYHGELSRKIEARTSLWPKQEKEWLSIVDMTKQNSLYERIRLADSQDQYNSNRLHRLVNASREVQGLPPIKLRAFVKWLNELKKWAKGRAGTPQTEQTKAAIE